MTVNDELVSPNAEDPTSHLEDAVSKDILHFDVTHASEEIQQSAKIDEDLNLSDSDVPTDTVESNDPYQHTEEGEDTNRPESNDDSTPVLPPKRPQSSYFIFMQEQRSKIQEENPEATSIGSIAKIVGQLWKNMSPEERKPYQDMAHNQKQMFQKEMESFKLRNPNYTFAPTGSSTAPAASELILPIGRIKKLCRLDPEVKSMSKDAVTLVTKCAELFTEALADEVEGIARVQKRKTLISQDLVDVCSLKEKFFFLKDDMMDLRQIQKSEERIIQKNKNRGIEGVAVSKSKKGTLTSFFQPRAK